ncbi:adenine deaminase [Rhizosphaericola mali]|uniref:Adenine deaminase n=1 Tax=Rhizosphaericola mali TaxID=2545455 RepID=A0A5P2G6C6_9BACT|nr:adenine deaminase [Rhizosphaericola mali]QES89492.1 adenine deaminase [Rhizosphaericola mali]
MQLKGNIVDIENKRIYPGEVIFENGKITAANELKGEKFDSYILPGFVDAHVHVESSMLIPSEFARIAVTHGTVSTVNDPHEIANVIGIEGVKYMIENGKQVPFKFNFGAPSCVPATVFETAGATLDSKAVAELLASDDVKYLAEMMNFPGVLFKDPEVLAKIEAAHKAGKPVDGHAPGLRGEDAAKYAAAGITTDHECFTAPEALDKLAVGMHILIREGSAAKNFEALIDLLNDYPDKIMFCSDDKHPDSLVLGHINQLCQRAVAKGIDIFKILQAACINPVKHYKLDVGLLKIGDPADFIEIKDLKDFQVLKTYIDGQLVAENGQTNIESVTEKVINQFEITNINIEDLAIKSEEYPSQDGKIPVMEALDGQLITNKLYFEPKLGGDLIISDAERDILKMVVVNRYFDAPVAKAFIKNFNFKSGAIASTVAHDSHNIIAVGVDDESIYRAIQLLIAAKGGVSWVNGAEEKVLPLPVAGLMSEKDGFEVAKAYTEIDHAAKSLGSQLSAPYMTLSFMALLVIPHLKLSDKGIFDGDSFSFL